MNTLTFQTKIESSTINLSDISNFIGKDVIITIIELPKTKEKKKRKWNYLGAVKLNKKLDKVNIRDLAYE